MGIDIVTAVLIYSKNQSHKTESIQYSEVSGKYRYREASR